MHAKLIILSLILSYGALVLLAFLLQRQMTYYPGKEFFSPKEWSLSGFETLTLTIKTGLQVKSWYHPPLEKEKPVIVFFQGNALHLGYRSYKFIPWLETGYGLLLVGYPGYNGNPGNPSEEGIYSASRAAITAIGQRETKLVFYGESIGTGAAVQMATEFAPKALILESPLSSLPDIGACHYPYLPVRWLMLDRFDTLSKIGKVKAPLLWLHGEQDTIVPIRYGREVYEAAPEPKEAVMIPQAGHNDLYDFDAQAAVLGFLSSQPKRPANPASESKR